MVCTLSLSSHKRALNYKECKQDAALKVKFVIFSGFSHITPQEFWLNFSLYALI